MIPLETNEYFDIYDEEGNFLGNANRTEVHQKGLWHRSFHCWILFKGKNQEKFIIAQRRGPFVKDYPNYLDISAAGHYKAGEGIEGGIRELEEELGIVITLDQLEKMGVRTINERLYNGSINREFQDIYFLVSPVQLSEFSLQYPEVTAVFQLPILEVHDLLHERRATISAKGLAAVANNVLEQTEQTFTQNDFISDSLEYLRFIMRLASDHLDSSTSNAFSIKHTQKASTLPDGSRWQPV